MLGEVKMSVIFGYVMDKKVYLAADNRITDADGKFISDDDIKIEVVNNNTAVAFAGNYGAQPFFMKCYKDMQGYQNWFVNDLVSNIYSMCNAIINMNTEWAKLIANSNACFLVAGRTVDRKAKLFAVTLRKKHIDLKPVSMMLFHPNDCDFQTCANILCKNIKQYPDNFSKYTIQEISKISNLVSDSGNVWMFDTKNDESTFVAL